VAAAVTRGGAARMKVKMRMNVMIAELRDSLH
jgi:hypothetical protein